MTSVEELGRRFCTWMADLPDHMTRVPLSHLAIPGTHNAFSADLDPSLGVAVDQSWLMRVLGRVSWTRSVFLRWGVNQRLSVRDQLHCGIRYLDLRIAVRPDSRDFHFLHGLYGPKVIDTMREIRAFLEDKRKEVVILDFNHFYNMSDVDHGRLLTELRSVFRELLILPRPEFAPGCATLRDLWRTSGRVYVFYHHDLVRHTDGFWSGCGIPSPWPNTNKWKGLLEFLDRRYRNGGRRQNGSFYVWQCVVTPRTRDIARHPWGSLEKTFAPRTCAAITDWLNGKVAGPNAINICLGDFVDSNDFIPTVVGINHQTYRQEEEILRNQLTDL